MRRSLYYVLDDDHRPVASDLAGWSRWMTVNDKRVALTELRSVAVSTDHSHGSGRPVLFETMTFRMDVKGEPDCWRWSTWDEAVEGHKRIVSEMQAAETRA